jgi:hypothetical protein
MLSKSRVGFCWPSKLISPGQLDERSFKNVIDRIEDELDANVEPA